MLHPVVESAHLTQGEWNASVTLNLDNQHPIAPTLFGIFFEEIGHAGEGGLYAELVQDRSFDAIATATGFLAPSPNHSNAKDADGNTATKQRLIVDLEKLQATHLPPQQPPPTYKPSSSRFKSKHEEAQRLAASTSSSSNGIIIAWASLGLGTQTALSRELPLNPGNPVSMEITIGAGQCGGIMNGGYWGIHVAKGVSYTISLYMRTPDAPDTESALPVQISLLGADISTSHASLTLNVEPSGGLWKKYSGILVSEETDSDARLAIMFEGPATLSIDSVSLFPSDNVKKGEKRGFVSNPWPFRSDLLQALKDLKPGFLRFPGGCYVEGDWMRNAFNWKGAVGLNEERPGHYNLWGYWSTDGLGLFEYMTLAEELDTEPVWVINNGVAHGDSIPTADVMPLVKDALDSLEFIMGSPNSTWGSVRASMGRTEPWQLTYMAIGNEDCGKPFYTENYNLFFGALISAYPHLRLISNCDMGTDAVTDIFDWHVYTNPRSMFDLRTAFDGRDPAAGHLVFASEYAVTEGGGWGNLIGAIAEAGFMTGLERNGAAVPMAAYAPLFVHWNDRPWPTNLVVIDNHRWFGIPSYHIQRLFRETQGVAYIDTQVAHAAGQEVHEETVAASATCQDLACKEIVVKIVNFSSMRQGVAVEVKQARGGGKRVRSSGDMVVITGEHPEDENSFENPLKIAPVGVKVQNLSNSFVLEVDPWSVTALLLSLEDAPAAA